MSQTAESVEILWTAAHLIGLVAALSLTVITWRRRAAVVQEIHPPTLKGPRIRVANRRLRERSGRAAFHFAAMILGLLAMGNVPWVDNAAGWMLVMISAVPMLVSLVELSEEVTRP